MPSKAMNMVSERPDQSLFGDADRSDDMEHGLVQELVAPAGWDEASYLRVAEIADGGEAWQQGVRAGAFLVRVDGVFAADVGVERLEALQEGVRWEFGSSAGPSIVFDSAHGCVGVKLELTPAGVERAARKARVLGPRMHRRVPIDVYWALWEQGSWALLRDTTPSHRLGALTWLAPCLRLCRCHLRCMECRTETRAGSAGVKTALGSLVSFAVVASAREGDWAAAGIIAALAAAVALLTWLLCTAQMSPPLVLNAAAAYELGSRSSAMEAMLAYVRTRAGVTLCFEY